VIRIQQLIILPALILLLSLTAVYTQTTPSAYLVKDINPALMTNVSQRGSSPRSFVEVEGILYFVANDGTNGGELWLSQDPD
jgi:general stress protein 26